jgi:hypothetical protein
MLNSKLFSNVSGTYYHVKEHLALLMELKRRDTLKAIGGIAALATVGSSPALGQPNDVDAEAFGLGYLEDDDVLDNQELETILQGLESENPDLVTVEQIGESNQGRPLYSVAVEKHEHCPTVMAIAKQHGDEWLQSESLLGVVQFLTSGDSRAESMLDGVSVYLVPRVNPDGFVARHRFNVDTDAPADDPDSDIFGADTGIFAASDEGVGWDINRYNRHTWTEHELYENFPDEYPENPVPEAVAVHNAMADVDPLWIIDFHRQGSYVVDYESEFDLEEVLTADDDDDTDDADDDDDMDDEEEEEMEDYPPDPDDPGDADINTGSVFWPINPDVSDDLVELSQQVVLSMTDHLTQDENVIYTRYPGGDYGGIARNGHALAGYGSVLFELDSATLFDREFRARQTFEAVLAAAGATADGSLYEIDTGRVDELPERGDSIGI